MKLTVELTKENHEALRRKKAKTGIPMGKQINEAIELQNTLYKRNEEAIKIEVVNSKELEEV